MFPRTSPIIAIHWINFGFGLIRNKVFLGIRIISRTADTLLDEEDSFFSLEPFWIV